MKADAGSIAGASPVRASQKEATRQRVLASARTLFALHGYQGTTIREIARDANVSVGSVFTTFASKGVILSEVMEARIEPLFVELDRVMPHLHGPTVDRLRTLFAIHIQFEMQNPRLFLSHIAAAYDWTLSSDAKPFGRNARLKGGVADCLAKGVADGDIRADVNLDDVVALIISAFAWTFRLAITQNADAKAMITVMDRQIGLIMEGLKPKP